MSISIDKIDLYCEAHTSAPSSVLQDLERETHLKTLAPQMVSGYFQGRLLSMISHMVRPKYILEVGTFTGYSAICLAEGLQENGVLHTIEVNPEYQNIIEKYFHKSGYRDKIRLFIGDGLEIIPTLPHLYDLVFIDAAKFSYPRFFDLIFEKVPPGGYILLDNMLWSGKVVQDDQDSDTATLRNFAGVLQNDIRLQNILLPVRDGLMICRKK